MISTVFTRRARILGLVAGLTLCLTSAWAIPITYYAYLDGPSESPPNASPGTGFSLLTIDTDADTLQLDFNFSDLIGNTTAAHIHAPVIPPATTAGVATQVPYFVGFPVGVTSGSYSHLFDLADSATYNPAYVTANGGTVAGAEAALAAALANGQAYLNIHSTFRTGGEIRGFYAPVPEPATAGLLALGLGGWQVLRRRRAARARAGA